MTRFAYPAAAERLATVFAASLALALVAFLPAAADDVLCERGGTIERFACLTANVDRVRQCTREAHPARDFTSRSVYEHCLPGDEETRFRCLETELNALNEIAASLHSRVTAQRLNCASGLGLQARYACFGEAVERAQETFLASHRDRACPLERP